MKPKGLLIAVGVLAVLGGLVYYTEENPPSTGDEKPAIIDVEVEEVAQVRITRPDHEPITIERGEDDSWTFGAPITFPIDDNAAGLVMSNAAELNADRLVEDFSETEGDIDWAPYGLDGDGALRLDVSVKDSQDQDQPAVTHTVILGNDTPTGAGVYARREGDPRLYTVFSYVKSSFEKEVFDLRDKNLIRVDNGSISRVTAKVRERTFEFGKGGDDKWQILKPRPLRADNFSVGDYVRSVRDAEMQSVLAESAKDAAKYPFDSPYAVIEIVDAAGSHTVEIAQGEGDAYHARSSDLDGVYEFSSSVAEGLDKQLDDFRNKKLFDFGFNELAELHVRDGATEVKVRKEEDQWLVASNGDREADSQQVQTLIDSLRSLSALSFPSDDRAAQSAYGLDSALLVANVVPAEAGNPEGVLIATRDERFYAARVNEASTYEVERSAVEEIQRAVEALTNPPESAAEPEEASSEDTTN